MYGQNTNGDAEKQGNSKLNDALDDFLSLHYPMPKTLIHFRAFPPSLFLRVTVSKNFFKKNTHPN